jgi:hypothetical protein
MGCAYELNDTLLLDESQGFPSDILDRDKHVKNPVTLADVQDKIFSFKGKATARIYQLDPVRVYLVQNTSEGKWLHWGRAFIQSLLIERIPGAPDDTNDTNISFKPGDWTCSGTYKIVTVLDPAYQKVFTCHEAPPAWNYFAGDCD